MNMVRPAPHVAEGPQPLLRSIPPGEPYPAGALGPLREAVEAAQRITQAPVAIAGQSALAMASLAVQAHADVATLAGMAPLSLFALTVARSGERKSTVDRLFMAGLRDHEREAARAHRDDCRAHENAAELRKGERDRILAEAKRGKGEKRTAAQADLEALGAPPPAPLAPNLTATEPTFEGLVKLYIAGQPSLGLFSDEGAQFLGGHAMNADNRLKTIAGLSSLWDGAPINRTRGGDGTVTLLGRRLAAHLLVQPIAARPLLADPVAMGQGFLARFLIAEPPSAIGTRFVTDAAAEPVPALAAYAARLRAILTAERPTAPDDPQELRPRTLPLSAEARDASGGLPQRGGGRPGAGRQPRPRDALRVQGGGAGGADRGRADAVGRPRRRGGDRPDHGGRHRAGAVPPGRGAPIGRGRGGVRPDRAGRGAAGVDRGALARAGAGDGA